MRTAFYCVADERYFLGAAGVLNSLRLHGHDEPVFVLDCGLTERQRGLLEPHATMVANRSAAAPWLAKTIAPLEHPADVAVLIDTDMVVTRSLGPLIEDAARGRVVAFANDRPRFVAEWGELLDLGTAEPGTYASSGLVALGGELGRSVLELVDDRQRRVDLGRTIFGDGGEDYAFRFPEQDVLNAVLCTRVDRAAVSILPNRLAPNPPFAGLRIADLDRARCRYADGTEPFVLHHFGRKPWIDPVYHGLYSRLLSRLLRRSDVPLTVPEAELPLRMRTGPRARLARARVDAADVMRRRVLRREGRRA